jgi:hypothetical protein
LISNFCHVLNVVFFLLGDSTVSEFYVPTWTRPMKTGHTEHSETSAHKTQTQGNHPKERMQQGLIVLEVILNWYRPEGVLCGTRGGW